jgi:hypothetical protein
VRNAAEPGSSPWAAASTAPAVGSRKSERVYGGGGVCSGRPRTWCPLSLETACVTYMATARPWRRGHPRRGGEEQRKRERTKGPALSPDWRARAWGCTLMQGRWTRAASRANANASGNTTRRRVHGRYGAVCYGDKEELSQRASARR